MGLASGIPAFFTDPTYDVPLAIAVALGVGLVWWSLARTKPLPSPVPLSRPEGWARWSDTFAYEALKQGHYFLTLYRLWQRLGAIAMLRFRVRIESGRALDSPAMTKALPSPLTPRRVVNNLARAYYSAFWADQPSWIALQWPWWKRRRQRRAAADFARAVADLSVALPALEGGR
jgi:hypothetical protein